MLYMNHIINNLNLLVTYIIIVILIDNQKKTFLKICKENQLIN